MMEFEKSVADCNERVKRFALQEWPYCQRAWVYNAWGKHDKAISDCDEAIRLAPKSTLGYANRADAYLATERWTDALADFETHIQLFPDSVHIWSACALLWLRLGDSPQYRSLCRQMLKRFRHTQDPVVADEVAWTCAVDPSSVENWSVCLELAETAVQRDPGNPHFVNTLGAVLYRMDCRLHVWNLYSTSPERETNLRFQ